MYVDRVPKFCGNAMEKLVLGTGKMHHRWPTQIVIQPWLEITLLLLVLVSCGTQRGMKGKKMEPCVLMSLQML